jgi:hypothetical protein
LAENPTNPPVNWASWSDWERRRGALDPAGESDPPPHSVHLVDLHGEHVADLDVDAGEFGCVKESLEAVISVFDTDEDGEGNDLGDGSGDGVADALLQLDQRIVLECFE